MTQLKPHLAEDVVLEKLKYPVWLFPKIDGVRLMHLIGKATGRSLKEHDNRHITERFSKPIYEGFDGEVTMGDIRGQSLCRDTTSATGTIKGEPDVVWNLFDWLREDVIEMPYRDRYGGLAMYLEHVKPEGVCLIEYVVAHNEEELLAQYQAWLDEGYEGLIVRDPEGLHKNGRATVKLGAYLRLKPSSDKEAIVKSLVEAMENQNEAVENELGRMKRSAHQDNMVGKGMVGMLICTDVLTGQEINVGAGKMTHEERIDFFLHPEKILGKPIKYRSLDTGIKDKPRFARYICLRNLSDMS